MAARPLVCADTVACVSHVAIVIIVVMTSAKKKKVQEAQPGLFQCNLVLDFPPLQTQSTFLFTPACDSNRCELQEKIIPF